MQMTTRFASALRAGVASGVLALSGAVAGGLMLSGAAMADDFVVGNGQTETTTQTLPDAGDTLLIEQGGTIDTGNVPVEHGVLMDNTDQTTTNNGAIATQGDLAVGIFSNLNAANATINNNGSIETTGSSATGIESEAANAMIDNSGSISTTGDNAQGILSLGADAMIDNSGSISTTGASALGIWSQGADAMIDNSGSISTTGGNAYGILSQGADAMIDNSGSISTMGSNAHDILSQGANAQISNEGSISTTGTGANGILSQGSNAQISNNGSISTMGAGGFGIFSNSTGAEISNSGSISTEGIGARGIWSTGADAMITNSGVVISEQSDAIRMTANDAKLNLLAGSAIQGDIYFGPTNSATLNIGPGLNTYYLLDGVPDSINVNGMPVADAGNAVVIGSGLVVIDPTGFAVTDEVITDLTRSITGSVEGHLAAQRACYGDNRVAMGNMSVSPVADLPPVPMTCGTGLWGSLYGGYSDMEASGIITDAEHGFGGLVVGYDRALSMATTGGLFGGFAKGEVTTPNDAFSNDMTTAYGGAYLSHVTGSGIFFDLSVTAGVVMNDTERLIGNNMVAGGLETASADYDGILFSPSLKVGFDQGLGGSTLTPSVRVRYAGLYLDGYEETGSAAALAVGDRNVHVVEFGVNWPWHWRKRKSKAASGTRNSRAAWTVFFNWGDDVNASLLGNDLAFAAGDDDSIVRGWWRGGCFHLAWRDAVHGRLRDWLRQCRDLHRGCPHGCERAVLRIVPSRSVPRGCADCRVWNLSVSGTFSPVCRALK